MNKKSIMSLKKIILFFVFFILTLITKGQGFTYSFTDPCTFKIKELTINNPNGNVVLFYNGQFKSFTPQDLINGRLQQWVSNVNSTNPSGPCSGIGLSENTSLNSITVQNNIAVLTTVLNTLTELSQFSTLDGLVGTTEKSQSKKKDKKKSSENNESKSSKETSENNEIKNSNETKKSVNKENNESSENNESKSSNESKETSESKETKKSESKETKSSNESKENNETKKSVTKETSENNETKNSNETKETTDVKKSTETNETNKKTETNNNNETKNSNPSLNGVLASIQTKEKLSNVKKGSLIMNGDVVVIRSANESNKDQLRVNMSVINSNTKNTFAKGALLNFTSSINNSCLTLFGAWRMKKLTSIVANSSMLNFQKDFFNTTSVMESYKVWKLTTTIGVNITTGNLGKSNFKSLAMMSGVIGSFDINKKIGLTPMLVVVYSPYVYFYQGIWYKSGWLLVPFTAVDYRITKKFKMNVSFSGIHRINNSTLNFQVLLGAKTLL
jgi:hypothetical protein